MVHRLKDKIKGLRDEKRMDCVFAETALPLKTRVAHLACISEMGIMAPSGCTKPMIARVGRSNSGGNTYLYRDVLFSEAETTCEARNGKENL